MHEFMVQVVDRKQNMLHAWLAWCAWTHTFCNIQPSCGCVSYLLSFYLMKVVFMFASLVSGMIFLTAVRK